MEPVPNRAHDPRRGKFRSRQIAEAQARAADRKAFPEMFRYRKQYTYQHPDLGTFVSHVPLTPQELDEIADSQHVS